jgi:hypothetical protein
LRGSSPRDALSHGAVGSTEHRRLVGAIAKANGDRERAIKNVCRLYAVKSLDQLPAHIKSAVREALS